MVCGSGEKVKVCLDSYLEHQGSFPANKYLSLSHSKILYTRPTFPKPWSLNGMHGGRSQDYSSRSSGLMGRLKQGLLPYSGTTTQPHNNPPFNTLPNQSTLATIHLAKRRTSSSLPSRKPSALDRLSMPSKSPRTSTFRSSSPKHPPPAKPSSHPLKP